MSDDPFAVLGLPARAGLSDEDVRAAWKRVAAATHPDREDGGDPARFGPAAAAYVTLRTSFGRGEALADLGLAGAGPGLRGWRGRLGWQEWLGRQRWLGWRGRFGRRGLPGWRGRFGRQRWLGRRGSFRRQGLRGWRLVFRAAAAVGVAAAGVAAVGWTPATIGLLVGAITWVAVMPTGQHDRGS